VEPNDSVPPRSPPASLEPSTVERWFETILWRTRFLALFPVVFALLVALTVTVFASVDVVRLVGFAVQLTSGASEMELASGRLLLVAKVVKIVDLFLVSTFMIIFALGVYELFIGKIDAAERSEVASRLLLIHDIDDLKERLTKILLLILAMLYLEFALRLEPQTGLELLYLAVGTALTAFSLFLTQKGMKRTSGPPRGPC
jgi:uncharacterized membrane protein YqhA